MLPHVAVDVEAIGILVAPLVPVGRSDEQQHRAPFRNGYPVVLDVAGDVAREVRPVGSKRSVSSIACGISVGSATQLAALVGVLAQDLPEPADQSARRLVSGSREHLRVGEHLRPG